MTTEDAPPGHPDALLRRHQALLDVADLIHTCQDLDELFRKLTGSVRRLVAFDAIAVALLDEEKTHLRIALIESWVSQAANVGLTVPRDVVPAGWVIEHQQPLRVRTADNDPRFPLHNERMKEAGFAVSFHLPLTTSLTRLGELIFAFTAETELPESEIDFMQRIADQVAIAIENAINFEQARGARQELEHRNRQREQLLTLSNHIVSHLGLQDVLRATVSIIRSIVPCALSAIALPDDDGQTLRLSALEFPAGKGLLQEGIKMPIDGSNAGQSFKTGEPIVLDVPRPESYSPEMYGIVAGEGLRALCFVPLVSRGRSLGVLSMTRTEDVPFTPDEVDFLKQVAGQIAIAVENALHFEQLRVAEREVARERDRKQLLLEVNNAVVSHLDMSDLVESISASLRRVVPHDAAAFTLYDETTGKIQGIALHREFDDKGVFERGKWISAEGTPEGEAITTRRPVLVREADLARFHSPLVRKAHSGGVRSGCAVPLIAHGRLFGLLSVVSLQVDAFTEEDALLLDQCSSQIAIALENALAYHEIAELKDRLAQEKLYLEDEIRSEINFEEIIGESPALKNVLQQVQTVASSDSTVLILGETGTGKELIARAIHEASRRKGRTFVKLNCAAIPTGLLESELFGHERGAFTGAIAQKVGRMELANGGTLFLDEVGDIPLELQPKLLRALQEREFERLGSVRTQKSDVRFLAATNRHLPEMVAEKQFRSDLFYRLNVFPISIPSLRERRDDIPRLVRYFVSKYAKKMDKVIESIPTAAMHKLQAWHWPGNVRELENVIERSVILTNGPVLHIPLTELEASAPAEPPPATLRETERDHILRVLRDAKGVLAGPDGAAARLGVKRTTLQYKMKKLGITRDSL